MDLRRAAAFFVALLLAACEKTPPAPAPTPPPPPTVIGASGGRLEAGGARLEIPAGALSGNVDFRVREAGGGLEIATDRALFAKPIAITLPVKVPAGVAPDRV